MASKEIRSDAKRILLVDDHPVLRKGLVRLIDSKKEFIVCGEAGSADQAMALMRELKADLVIVDIGLPGPSGIDLTKTIRGEFPQVPILVLSMHEEALYATRALRAGAMGYIVKQDAIENIAAAMRDALAGKRYISPVVGAQMSINGELEPEADEPIAVLSDRELEIFELIGRGHEVADISSALKLSPKTVETHRTNIKEKLKLKNARQVARLAVQWVTQHSS
jgi:DNA-binding NarL/FixJ family response regulator